MGTGLRPRLEAWLNRRWYGDRRPEWPLRLLARLQGCLVDVNRRRAEGAWQAPVPVVVVGNLTAGGSGKTPLVAWLASQLKARGLRVGIVSRGYGRRRQDLRLLGEDDDWRSGGDEPLLLHHLTASPVAVGRDRVAACQLLLAHHSIDLILSDDGLQHYRLHRDRELLVIDRSRGFGNGRLLPAGPLREPVDRARLVDWTIWSGGVPAGETGLAMTLSVDEAVRLADGSSRPLGAFAPGPVRAVAGIGDPARFFDSLEAYGLKLFRETPGDHGQWQPGEEDYLPVLMTDKDAIKLHGQSQGDWWRVPLKARVSPSEALLDDIQSLISNEETP
ncbi:tetraacyldisaccharide 4'-kinase [Natronospira proteinivora]|uniref:Tetraacyldisaccharide 4'-kinase n=1 Tax=Natronospira proteinivora TaxID=1807133 RepID=A0ABT1G614_9GAMM|nr:tetraacyldisaccharide 4'-kinase [Natronospira proteinivora]MCP1726706.1 tetraacyldisaccharide 4'-kinase [Natronospira proteinivora]